MSLCEGDSAVLSGRIDFGAGRLIPTSDGKEEVLGVFSSGFLLPIGNSPALATGAQSKLSAFAGSLLSFCFTECLGLFFPVA